ncbi:glycosyltransferase [Pseudoalteromonas sp. MMG005]|uniref:glycosyltransferase n=1 Tax=Pseudoalteromonas sp. MMG005 TaxID=2822682 RepID=UPI001B39FF67|nr:glycosyltransferase family 8 protein [Pseudoalteromonas sp. MMG005]
MKKVIFTLAIGDNPMYQAAILSFKHYADKVGADLIVSDELHYPINIRDPHYGANPAWAEKLRIGELLKEYDRVLYLDADILISPSAQNIFKQYTDPMVVYMLNEGAICDRQCERQLIENKLGRLNWPMQCEDVIYYNVGVVLASQGCKLFDYADLAGLQSVCNHIRFYEQTFFNYQIFKNALKHKELATTYNRMDMFGKEGYLEADFIHYAGKGYAKNSRRRDVQFLKDFATLYDNILPRDKMEALKAHAWHDYLNVVCKKYPLPNWLIKQCCRWFVPH